MDSPQPLISLAMLLAGVVFFRYRKQLLAWNRDLYADRPSWYVFGDYTKGNLDLLLTVVSVLFIAISGFALVAWIIQAVGWW
jgi:hypothetical protein